MKKLSIVVIGSSGFIGSRIVDKLNSQFNLIGLNHQKLDITRISQVEKLLSNIKADWIIHAAAIAHIDKCENDRKLGDKSQTWKVNVEGTNNIALVCNKLRKRLLFLSTECIFDGKKGLFKEDDKPNPINWYGQTKYFGEQKVIESGIKFCILRAVLAYGHPQAFKNDLTGVFYKEIIRQRSVKAVSDQSLNVTFIDDLVDAISILIKNQAEGIYHYCGDKIISPYEIAQKIKFHTKSEKIQLYPMSLSDYFGKKAKLRLPQATLSCEKIQKDFGINYSNFNRALTIVLNRYRKIYS